MWHLPTRMEVRRLDLLKPASGVSVVESGRHIAVFSANSCTLWSLTQIESHFTTAHQEPVHQMVPLATCLRQDPCPQNR